MTTHLTSPAGAPVVAACLKWTGGRDAPADDERFAGISESDQAALEIALRLGEALGGATAALTVGPAAADRALRDAVACGAARAVRIDGPADSASAQVADELAGVLHDASVVVCGDVSADRGSGAVPAFLAHRLGRPQALGLLELSLAGADAAGAPALDATRRLDGGRRERLQVPIPCVVSVEGSVATLRRAGLRAVLAARQAPIEVRPAGTAAHRHDAIMSTSPYRPRARVLPAPSGQDALARVRALTEGSASDAHGETVVLDPPAAAARIVLALREWGYLGH